MKIRNGFVSNSSSSSFIIYGICEYSDELICAFSENEYVLSILKDNNIIYQQENNIFIDENNDEVKIDTLFEYIIDNKNCNLEHHNPYDDSYYIGLNLLCINDDETYKQFKERSVDELAKIGLDNFSTSIHEECWRDG